MEWCRFAPFNFAPQFHCAPTYHVPFWPRNYFWETHNVNNNIARCSIKLMWKCEKEAHDYIQPHVAVLLLNLSKHFMSKREYIDLSKGWNFAFVRYSKRGLLQVWFRCMTLNWPMAEIKWTWKYNYAWHTFIQTPGVSFCLDFLWLLCPFPSLADAGSADLCW